MNKLFNKWLLTILLLVLSGLVFTDTSTAASLSKGDRIRIKSVPLNGVFIFDKIEGDSLIVHSDKGIFTRTLDISRIESLDKSIQQGRGTAMLHNSILGGFIGAFLGVVVGYSSGEDCNDQSEICFGKDFSALLLGIVGGATGVTVGLCIGAIHPGYKWDPITLPLEARAYNFTTTDNVIGISLSIPIAP